ncbi:MAG: hypothetical protein C5B52_18855 [Bacteroidetes bacterium]|nr:MAG: hypothetical protein C5B52_18855 [Bacteroidota bacterium]
MSSYSYQSSYSQPDQLMSPTVSTPARIFAGFFSFLFHPLLVGLLMNAYAIYLNPVFFVGFSGAVKLQALLIYSFNGVFLPLFAVLLCKGLGFVKSIYLRTQKDRIFPYTISIVCFFWTFYVFRNMNGMPLILARISLGIFLATSLAFIFNIFFKISMHAIGVGGLCGMFVALIYSDAGIPGLGLPLILSILITGIVCTSRLMISSHNYGDIVTGFLLGVFCQFVAALIIA